MVIKGKDLRLGVVRSPSAKKSKTEAPTTAKKPKTEAPTTAKKPPSSASPAPDLFASGQPAGKPAGRRDFARALQKAEERLAEEYASLREEIDGVLPAERGSFRSEMNKIRQRLLAVRRRRLLMGSAPLPLAGTKAPTTSAQERLALAASFAPGNVYLLDGAVSDDDGSAYARSPQSLLVVDFLAEQLTGRKIPRDGGPRPGKTALDQLALRLSA